MSPTLFLALAPWVFVFLWSTGWISARAIQPYADPLTFLSWRFGLALVAMVLIALWRQAEWPTTWKEARHSLVSGALIHGVYLGAVWWVVGHGLPAGVSGVIAALQPILTAALGPFLIGERLAPKQWVGIIVGFLGILLVLAPKFVGVDPAVIKSMSWLVVINMLGMLAVTLGSFYQKRFVPTGDLTALTALQYAGAVAVVLPLAFWLEPMRFEVNLVSMATMAWSVIALSIGAVGLYLILIRKGAVTRAATLIYLVPPLSAFEAWMLFGETLNAIQIVGVLVTVAGVVLTLRKA
ncbi:MAG: hypothetical protein RL291_672 [Pseudomonadota bacterium]